MNRYIISTCGALKPNIGGVCSLQEIQSIGGIRMNRGKRAELSEDKKQLLQSVKVLLNKMYIICDEIENGKSEVEACKKYDINQSYFRRFIRQNWDGYKEKDLSPDNEVYFTWKDYFCDKIYNGSVVPREDFDEAFAIVMKTLEEREADIIRLCYQEDKTLEDIALLYGLSVKRIRDIRVKAERKLRHPLRFRYFKQGVEYCILENKYDELLHGKQSMELAVRKKAKEVEELKKELENGRIEAEDINEKIYNILLQNNLLTVESLSQTPIERFYTIGLNLGQIDLIFKRLAEKYGQQNIVITSMPIINCGFSSLLFNVLRRNNIQTVHDIIQYTESELRRLSSMGDKRMNELLEFLKENGLELKEK